MLNSVTLKKKASQFLYRRHPWIFSGAIQDKRGLENGQVVKVHNSSGEIVATGHYHDASIAIRVLEFANIEIDYSFYYNRLKQAWNFRKKLHLTSNLNTNAFRWINAEGDFLSGLVVDVYNDIAVIQCHTYGMYLHREYIAEAIRKIADEKIKHIYLNIAFSIKGVGENIISELLHGNKIETTISENKYQFDVNVAEGQKTGFFLDQRKNRELITEYTHKAKVLNAFAYTGGFSIYAARNGAVKVTSVDISQTAVSTCRANSVLNGIDSTMHKVVKADVKDFLKDHPAEYDIVILDPPAFAKSQKKRHNAVQAYKQLNINGIKCVKPGGMLFTFSCSQVVDRELFKNTIVAAAIEAQREIKIFHNLSQGPDHPINIFHQEGNYLKGLALQVL